MTFRVDGVPMPCEEFLLEQQRLGDAAMASGAPGLAAFYWSAVRSLGIHCPDAGAALIEQQQQAACERLVTAIDNANVVAADTYRGFLQSAGAIIVAEGAVQLRGGSCSADSSAALDLKFAQAALFFRARFSAAQLSGDLEAEFDMLDELIAFDGACQLAGLSVCKSLTEELYPPVLDAIRLGAWDTCQQVGAPRLLGVLFGDALTGARPVGRALSPQGSTQPYMTYADYTYGDLEDDISSCATRLDFHRFDDVLVPGEILPPPASMLPGASPGTTPHEATLDVFIGGSLTLTGKAPLPHCPDGAIPGGALVARVFGKEVGRAPAGSTHYTLDTRPLSLATSDLQAAAAGATQFDLDLVREDVACPSAPYTDPWIVARLHLTAVPPPVDNPLEGTYRGTGMYYSENGCGQCNPFAAVLKISPTPAGLQATVSGNSHVNGTLYSVIQNGDLVSGTSCTSCSEPLAFSAQRTGARLVGFAEWEVGCPGPGCKVTFDVTHD